MKLHIFPALRLTAVCAIVFAGLYTLLILGIAQAAPNKGLGQTISVNGKVKGYALEGQSFTQDRYFNGRPSAVGYNAAGSAGSNKGPSNPDYLKDVKSRIDTFLAHNPTVKKQDVPSELVTASGSGLDPDISPEAAFIQVDRISRERKLSVDQLKTLVQTNIQKPFAGMFGTSRVNVLRLNIALDGLK